MTPRPEGDDGSASDALDALRSDWEAFQGLRRNNVEDFHDADWTTDDCPVCLGPAAWPASASVPTCEDGCDVRKIVNALKEPPEIESRIRARGLDTFATRAVDWLWPGRIPAGELTVLAGDGGLGKSTLAARLAAQVTTGELVGLTRTRRVAVVRAEDDPERTLRPRYEAAGALMANVSVVSVGDREEVLVLPDDLDDLAAYVARVRPEFLVVDPLGALLSGNIDAHRGSGRGGMRQVLNPLSILAQEHGTTVLAVFHLNKGAGPASQRISGAADTRNAARNVLFFAQHPDARDAGMDDGRRVIGHDKCNYGPTRPTLLATIAAAPVLDSSGCPIVNADGEAATTAIIELGDESDVDYRQALASASSDEKTRSGDQNALGEAVAFLDEELAEGPVAARDLKRSAGDAGHAWRTVERAMTAIGVKSAKRGRTWVRYLPDHEDGGLGGDGESPVLEGNLAPSAPVNSANSATAPTLAGMADLTSERGSTEPREGIFDCDDDEAVR